MVGLQSCPLLRAGGHRAPRGPERPSVSHSSSPAWPCACVQEAGVRSVVLGREGRASCTRRNRRGHAELRVGKGAGQRGWDLSNSFSRQLGFHIVCGYFSASGDPAGGRRTFCSLPHPFRQAAGLAEHPVGRGPDFALAAVPKATHAPRLRTCGPARSSLCFSILLQELGGARRPLGGSAGCRGRVGFPAQPSDSQHGWPGRRWEPSAPQAATAQAVFSPEHRQVGEAAGSAARRCRLFICGFDAFVFSPRTGWGTWWGPDREHGTEHFSW